MRSTVLARPCSWSPSASDGPRAQCTRRGPQCDQRRAHAYPICVLAPYAPGPRHHDPMGRDRAAAAISPRAQAEHHEAVTMLAYDANMLRAANGGSGLMSWEEAHALWHELLAAGLLADRPDEAATALHCDH